MIHTTKEKGFTLIELLVVVSIISLLASVVVSSLNSAREGANNATINQEAASWINAIEIYRTTEGELPLRQEWIDNGASSNVTSCLGDGTEGECATDTHRTEFKSQLDEYIDTTANPNKVPLAFGSGLQQAIYTYKLDMDNDPSNGEQNGALIVWLLAEEENCALGALQVYNPIFINTLCSISLTE